MRNGLNLILRIAAEGAKLADDPTATDARLRVHLKRAAELLRETTQALRTIDDVAEQNPVRTTFIATSAMKPAGPIDHAITRVCQMRLLDRPVDL